VNREADKDFQHPYMSAFVVRLSDYAKKIAALVEISTSKTVEVSSETMEYTLSLIDWLKNSVINVMSETSKDELSQTEQRVYEKIIQHGNEGILHSTLKQKLSNLTPNEVETAIENLESSEKVRIEKVGEKGRGRHGRRYFSV
jgi:Zn-dependent oligopeptidase